MREEPALSPITSTTSAGSSPAISPSTIASAAARLWIVTRWLAMNFIRLPLPKAPTYFCAREKPASTSRQRSKAASSPLAKTTRSFAAACAPVPLTGQSSRIFPCAARFHVDRHRAAFDDDLAPTVARGDAALPRHHLLEGIDAGQRGDQNLGVFGNVARRGGGDPAGPGEPRHRGLGSVVADDLEAVP